MNPGTFCTLADFGQHAQHRLVGATVQRAVERRGRAGHGRIRVDVRAADAAHRARAAVLLVIGVQDEEHVERTLQRRVDVVLQLRHPEQHVQEVAREAQIVVRIDVGAADAVPERIRGNRRHFRNQAVNLLLARLLVEDRLGVRIERGKRRNRADQHAHRVRVVLETLHQLLDVLVHHRVEGDLLDPLLQLRVGRQLAEQDRVGGLEVVRMLGQLLDRIAAVFEDALVAVDVRDAAATRSGVHERGIVGGQSGIIGGGRS